MAQGRQGGLVVIDEAYQPFSSKSYIDRMSRATASAADAHAVSKFGLAGVRLGYMMGPKALIAEIDKVRPPYNISVLNCECAAVRAGARGGVRRAGRMTCGPSALCCSTRSPGCRA